MPTGEISGVFVADLDLDPEKGIDGRARLEELGHELPETLTIRTPRGGAHLYFRHTEGITNSTGGLPEGIDVRGEGGYVLLPPSNTEKGSYTIEHRAEVAEAPEWLLEMVRERRPQSRPSRDRDRIRVATGETIPEGSRNQTLFFEALNRKDAGRTQAEILEELLAINTARCSQPLGEDEVWRIVKSACRYPIRSGTPSPEVLEAVEQLEAFWWEHVWQGVGGKTDRDVYRVLIELARRYGRILEDGSVEVSASVRSVALAAATRYATVHESGKRLAGAGVVRKSGSGKTRKEHAAAWVLLPPRLPRNTQHPVTTSSVLPCVTVLSRRRLWDLETPAFRWTGHVKKGRAGVLYILEAHGPMSLEELAELMGWSRARDLRARYVDPLVGMGLLEERDGLLSLPGDYARRVEEVRRAPYTTVSRRRRESRDGDRVVRWVEETENVASEVEREEKDLQDHKKHREGFRLYLMRKSPGADERCRELLNAMDEERWSPDGEIAELEIAETCIHDVPGDPSMRMTRAECWLCGREGAA
jgi:predicted transcriptional regulator